MREWRLEGQQKARTSDGAPLRGAPPTLGIGSSSPGGTPQCTLAGGTKMEPELPVQAARVTAHGPRPLLSGAERPLAGEGVHDALLPELWGSTALAGRVSG